MKFLLIMALSCVCLFVRAEPMDFRELQDQVRQLGELIQDLNEKIDIQNDRIEVLERENASLKKASIVPESEVVSSSAQPRYNDPSASTWSGGFTQGLQAFNPEMGVVADIVAALSQSRDDTEGNDKLSVRELELVFAHDIDPYARFDSTFTLSDFEDPVIEEAYITFFTLPFDLKGRIGRIRPKIGKASAYHRDFLDTVDEPLVIQKYLGVEGLYRTAAEFSCFLPVPWEVLTHELTAGVMEGGIGEEGTLFGSTRRIPSFYAHLKNFWDISDVSNFELGGTYLLGSSDEDSNYEVNAFGIDVTFIHYVDPIHRLKVQSEFYFQDRDEAFQGAEEESETTEESLSEMGDETLPDVFENNPWGLYVVIDYRLDQRWSLGLRWDYVIPTDLADDALEDDDGALSGYLTFHQSEFARWRLQYQHIEFSNGSDDDRVFLQGTVAIGVHKHQLQ